MADPLPVKSHISTALQDKLELGEFSHHQERETEEIKQPNMFSFDRCGNMHNGI